mgnify:CR=1 FL=1
MPLILNQQSQPNNQVLTAKDFAKRLENSYLYTTGDYGSTKEVIDYICSFTEDINHLPQIKPESDPSNQINFYILIQLNHNQFTSVKLIYIRERFCKHFMPILQSKQYPNILLIQLPQVYLQECYQNTSNDSPSANQLLYGFYAYYVNQDSVNLSKTLLPLFELVDKHPECQHEILEPFTVLPQPNDITDTFEQMPLLAKELKKQNSYDIANPDENSQLLFMIKVITMLSYYNID